MIETEPYKCDKKAFLLEKRWAAGILTAQNIHTVLFCGQQKNFCKILAMRRG